MNMINLDMYAMRQMRNYRLRVKFAKFSYSGGCGITIRTTLFDAIEGYSYTDEDLEKYGASELIRQSISKFVETHEHELIIAIYNDETASLSQEIRDIIQRLKLHYKISYTIHGRDCIVWTDLFEYKKTFNYMVTQSNRVMTNAKIVEDSIRTFYNYDIPIILGKVICFINILTHTNKEETTMKNEKNVMEELSLENGALNKTIKMLTEDIDMYQHQLMEMNVDNEKLKDEVPTRMNNEKIRGKDTAISTPMSILDACMATGANVSYTYDKTWAEWNVNIKLSCIPFPERKFRYKRIDIEDSGLGTYEYLRSRIVPEIFDLYDKYVPRR